VDCDLVFFNESVISVEPPQSMTLKVVRTEPGVKGDRSAGGTKPATLETGAEIQVRAAAGLCRCCIAGADVMHVAITQPAGEQCQPSPFTGPERADSIHRLRLPSVGVSSHSASDTPTHAVQTSMRRTRAGVAKADAPLALRRSRCSLRRALKSRWTGENESTSRAHEAQRVRICSVANRYSHPYSHPYFWCCPVATSVIATCVGVADTWS